MANISQASIVCIF